MEGSYLQGWCEGIISEERTPYITGEWQNIGTQGKAVLVYFVHFFT